MFAVLTRRIKAGSRSDFSLFWRKSFILSSGRTQDSDLIKFTLIQSSGERHEVLGKEGWTLVEAVAKNNLHHKFQNFGICSGSGQCQTCHVHFKPGDYSKLPPSKDAEEEYVLEDNSSYTPGSSRLGCHLILCRAMHDMDVSVPESIIWDEENGPETS